MDEEADATESTGTKHTFACLLLGIPAMAVYVHPLLGGGIEWINLLIVACLDSLRTLSAKLIKTKR
jgi:hypothetical protein